MPILSDVAKILEDRKAINIITVDTRNYQNRLSDVCVIASGTSSRHMQSVADYVYRYLKKAKLNPYIEGKSESGWVLIEASGIEIHLFKPELREYYDLEELLTSGKRPI
ncbi:MAG: ribosome silencing factor [Holosporales bacterium]|jgi:ribosome-associated protein|nr:ribosome silencing factor [Holosporales bacterium]